MVHGCNINKNYTYLIAGVIVFIGISKEFPDEFVIIDFTFD
jgi:hypothetical protein